MPGASRRALEQDCSRAPAIGYWCVERSFGYFKIRWTRCYYFEIGPHPIRISTNMKVTVHGAAGGEVTGSAYLVQTRESNVLVDFGMFQGARKAENYNCLPKTGFHRLNAVVVTHAHLDHTGRLPLLIRAGYEGPIHATPATIDIADLILKDSAR